MAGPENKADSGTKDVNAGTLGELRKAMNFEEMTGETPASTEKFLKIKA